MVGDVEFELAGMDSEAYSALPEDPAKRRCVLERRTQPSDTKPPLDPVSEVQLAEIDEKSAQCYVEAEDMTYRLRCMAEKIKTVVPRYIRGDVVRDD